MQSSNDHAPTLLEAALQALKFPPKVTFGNLKPGVIAQRTNELEGWVNAMLSHEDPSIKAADELLSFLEASDQK
jgi:hypothetical protein